MSTELINRLTDEYRGEHLTLTTEEIRSIVENVIEKTKKHVAKKLIERHANLLEVLYAGGLEGLEERLNESLDEL
jgi:site-specific recombinase XerD